MLLEQNQIGKREDLADYITRVDAKSKPLLAMVPKEKELTNTRCDFQVDNFEDAEDNAVLDGADVETFDNASEDRALLSVYCQKFRDSAQVSDMAEEVSNVAGLSKGELAESIMKKLEKLSRDIEAALCSDNDTQAQAGETPYKTRGLGSWLNSSAQATLPVDENFRTPSGSLDNTAIANLTEDIVNNILQSNYEQTGKIEEYVLLCGPTLRRRFSTFTRISAGSTNVMSTIRTYNSNASEKKISNVIDRFEGDFGNIELHPTLFNAKFTSTAASTRRGYLLLMKLLAIKWKRYPRVKQLEDRGGGPRFLVDAIAAFKHKNPLVGGKFYATS